VTRVGTWSRGEVEDETGRERQREKRERRRAKFPTAIQIKKNLNGHM